MAFSWSFDRSFGRNDISARHTRTNPVTTPETDVVDDATIVAPHEAPPVPGRRRTLLMWVTGAMFVLFIAMVALALYSTSNASSLAETTSDLLAHSQRLARLAPAALRGDAAALSEIRESRDRVSVGIEALDRGGNTGTSSVPATGAAQRSQLAAVQSDWRDGQANANVIVDNQKTLVTVGAAVRKLLDTIPALADGSDAVATSRIQANGSAREVAQASQLQMLTQRIARRLGDLSLGAGVNVEGAAALSRDVAAYREALESLVGSARDSESRDRLVALQKTFASVQPAVRDVVDALPKLPAIKQAADVVVAQSDPLMIHLTALRAAYAESTPNYLWAALVSGMLALVGALLVARTYVSGASLVAEEARRGLSEAEDQEQRLKRANEANQVAILRLMNELQEVADGNLTMQATVSEDITGAIADSVNYTVEELRTLVGRINSTVGQVTDATSAAQDTSNRLLAASDEQSREIRSTGDAVMTMARQIGDVSGSAAESAAVARQSLLAAEDGQRAVQNSITGMNEIRDQIQETSKRIKRLGESSQEIGEIIELISDITEQTNVLALNAAIQAASAGEAGRGFSVVAEEVQRLAERSGEATKQIGALVRTIQTDTQDAVSAMERSTEGVVEGAKLSDTAGQSLANIGRISRQLTELIEAISRNTAVQAKSAGGMASSMEHMLIVNEETTQGTRRTAASIQQLAALALELKSSVARFKVN